MSPMIFQRKGIPKMLSKGTSNDSNVAIFVMTWTNGEGRLDCCRKEAARKNIPVVASPVFVLDVEVPVDEIVST